ncbi:DUF2087 domain-containing protein [Sporosarcina sp. NPDC096371]|uniref:DUF2087 domain-containing protein n=1 Tax=Sporosarcina sp. NPDC096371 TaxID=3364530 RepID=UPI0038285A43
MDISENFSIEVMEIGYVEENRDYCCLFCDKKVAMGVIYPVGEVLFEDWRYMEHHIEAAHGSAFEQLLSGGKESTGLSDQQTKLLSLIYAGKSDKEIQQELQIGSLSTIRNHRFALRKKEKQAKTLVAVMNLLKQQQATGASGPISDVSIEKTFEPPAELVRYFSEEDGRLISYQLKEYEREQLVAEVALLFRPGKVYTEKEVNTILVDIFEDYMLLRRELVDRGLLVRNDEGSEYRRVSNLVNGEGSEMDYKKELKLKAKEEKTRYGIFQIKNVANGKLFVGSTPNFKTLNGLKFSLNNGVSTQKELQADWNDYGKEQFEFVELVVVDEKDWQGISKKKILEKLLEKWLEELRPFGENGYNGSKKD